MSKPQRMIPLTDEFMKNKSIYDRIWVYLQLNSYLDTVNKKRYVYSDLLENEKALFEELDMKKNKKSLFSYPTFQKSLHLLFEPTDQEPNNLGYLIKGSLKNKFDKEITVYYLKETERFKLIPVETLDYLMTVSNNNVIKIYSYLLNCDSYIKSIGNNKYKFSKKELSDAIGYTSKSFNKNIDPILESLESCGLIKYHVEQVQVSKTTKTWYYILDETSYYRTNIKHFSLEEFRKEWGLNHSFTLG